MVACFWLCFAAGGLHHVVQRLRVKEHYCLPAVANVDFACLAYNAFLGAAFRGEGIKDRFGHG